MFFICSEKNKISIHGRIDHPGILFFIEFLGNFFQSQFPTHFNLIILYMVKIQSILTRARLTTLTISNGFQNELGLNANQERIKFQLKTNLSCWSKFHVLCRVHMIPNGSDQSYSQVGFVHHLYKNQHPHEPLPWTLLWINTFKVMVIWCMTCRV